MKYDWDEAKNGKNVAKHGLSWLGVWLSLAHAPRDDGTRIISMRKGNRGEQKSYQERLATD